MELNEDAGLGLEFQCDMICCMPFLFDCPIWPGKEGGLDSAVQHNLEQAQHYYKGDKEQPVIFPAMLHHNSQACYARARRGFVIGTPVGVSMPL